MADGPVGDGRHHGTTHCCILCVCSSALAAFLRIKPSWWSSVVGLWGGSHGGKLPGLYGGVLYVVGRKFRPSVLAIRLRRAVFGVFFPAANFCCRPPTWQRCVLSRLMGIGAGFAD